MSNLSALVGAILFAWLPEDENPHHPGPKFRPVLVINADPNAKRILVAYGTSQNVERNGKGEITFRTDEVPGLSKDTKFCLAKAKWIPVSPEFLYQSPAAAKLAVLGMFPRRRSHELMQRVDEVSGNY